MHGQLQIPTTGSAPYSPKNGKIRESAGTDTASKDRQEENKGCNAGIEYVGEESNSATQRK